MTDPARAVIEAARNFVWRERWRMELPPDRPVPSDLAATLERALKALDAAEGPADRFVART